MLKMLDRIREARRNDEDGFTLIELLIVIVILGVLAGIVVFSVQGIQDRGKESACKADVATVQTAIEAYYAQYGNYGTQANLMAPPADPNSGVAPKSLLKAWPNDVVLSGDSSQAVGTAPCNGYTAGTTVQ